MWMSSSEQVEVMIAEVIAFVVAFGLVLMVVAMFALAWADMSARRRQDALINRPETYGDVPPWERESSVEYEIHEYGDRR